MNKSICPYRGTPRVTVWAKLPWDTEVNHLHYFAPGSPINIKRIRLHCPICGRRLLSSVRTDHDDECVIHSVPYPHKRKAWWKKTGFHHRKSGRNKRARYTGRRQGQG